MTRAADVEPQQTLHRFGQRYVANLAALYRRDAELAERLEALPFAELPALEPTRDGHWTVKLTADDGKSIYAHSRYQPVAEAARLVEARPEQQTSTGGTPVPQHTGETPVPHATAGETPVPQATAGGTPVPQAHADNPAFVIYGPGLGYVLAALEQRCDRPLLIVCEDDLRLLKAALCLHDLSGAIGAGRAIFLWSLDKAALSDKLMRANADVLLGLQYITPPHAKRYHADFHRQMSKLLLDFAATTRTQIVTLLRTARVTTQNVAYNTPYYLAQPGVEALAGRAAGYPAIVVAAGPSLMRNIDQLAALRERAVIISVQTVFKLLLSLGVEPHFVTSLDFHEVSAEFFRDAPDVGNCALVAEPKATWHVLDAYPGRKFVLYHRAYETLLGAADPRHAELKPGSTVAHLAFYLAQHLGCDPIIFVGQDLAFTDGLFYLPGSPIEVIWGPEMGRFQTIETKQWERIVRNRPILRRVRDVQGREVYTDDLLFTYAEQFEADFAAWRGRVIQASEGGIALRNTEALTLAQAAERYCTRALPADLGQRAGEPGGPVSGAEPQNHGTAGALAALQTRVEELAAVRAIAAEMRDLLIRLAGLLERPQEFNRTLVRVDELRTVIKKYDAVYRLVLEVSSTAELRRHGADRQIGTVQRETADTARQRLKRDREFVQDFLAGCDFLADVLPQAIQRVRAHLTGGT